MEFNTSSTQKQALDLPPSNQQSSITGSKAQDSLREFGGIILDKDIACSNLINKPTTVEPGIVPTQRPDLESKTPSTSDEGPSDGKASTGLFIKAQCSDALWDGPHLSEEPVRTESITRRLTQVSDVVDDGDRQADQEVLA